MKNRRSYVLGLHDIDKTKRAIVGGKGANLGELARMEGIHVPDGFCISTAAYKRIIDNPSIHKLIDQVSGLKTQDRNKIAECSKAIRGSIEETPVPHDITEEITYFLSRYDEKDAYAVRSSATAEDLPTASFAGQQDTYLNIIGRNAILKHISKCWASLFTERAIMYRMQHGFDHHAVQLAVVVQKMVFPQAAGILFTADPVTSNRKVLSIDASFGLGEALVSGLVNADRYRVCNGSIAEKKISGKKLAHYALPHGGTKEEEVDPQRQNTPALTDEQIVQLGYLGRKIEEHFNYPQDIEWCLADGEFYIVQSRPITTLYPIPEEHDGENHIYVSVGHQQMMTDAMKPLGLSFFLLMTRAHMRTAGGRLFVDITPILASPEGRETIMDTLGKSDPLINDALMTLIARKDFIKPMAPNGDGHKSKEQGPGKSNRLLPDYKAQIDYDPAIVPDLIRRSEVAIDELKQNIQTKSGAELFDFILEDIRQFRKSSLDTQSFAVIMTAMNASSWINEKMMEWLGEKNAADTLAQSVPNNITSEMGLALLDVADVIRPYPEVIGYLQHVRDDNFLDGLLTCTGGREARDAIQGYLDRYGMRCSGEIDITKARWSEKPLTLVPAILTNIKSFEPGAGIRKFERGQQEALKKEQELLNRLACEPDGEAKVAETKRKITLIRNFSGYREYPKYGIVSRYFVYKQALLKEAEQLVHAGVIGEKEDVYYLTFQELHDVVRAARSDHAYRMDAQIVRTRKSEFNIYEKLTPPRVMTSDGEILTGKYNKENLPAGAMVGLAVSSGVIEGRARVIVTMEDADLEDGDILVSTFTDPSWTPLFVSIKGLVAEVGGLMTHGAVIAREYGLPAVVGVEHATRLIKDGQRIRVNGTDGYVEILQP